MVSGQSVNGQWTVSQQSVGSDWTVSGRSVNGQWTVSGQSVSGRKDSALWSRVAPTAAGIAVRMVLDMPSAMPDRGVPSTSPDGRMAQARP